MKNLSKILFFFEVKKGEVKIIGLLILFSFFMGIANAFYYTSATSLFLQKFERIDLPIAYIAGGTLMLIFGHFFRKFQKKYPLSVVFHFSIVFLIVTVGCFLLVGSLAKGGAYVVYILFIWIKIFVYLLSVTFWGMAQKLFDLRQAKRIYGLISTGEVVSFILSFLVIPFILRIDGVSTYELLYVSLFGLLGSLAAVNLVCRTFKSKLRTVSFKFTVKKNESVIKDSSNISAKYKRLLYIMSGMTMFSLIFVDFIFFAQSQVAFEGHGEELSGFLAVLFGLISAFEFLTKTFVSGKLLSRYGVKLGLVLLPLLLLITTVLIIIVGTFDFVFLFFPLIAFLKLFMRIGKNAFYDPAFQILYQPIPSESRLLWQSKVDSAPKAIGNIGGGVLVLCISALSNASLVHYSYIFLAVFAYWIMCSFATYSEYRFSLKEIIKTKGFRNGVISAEPGFSALFQQLLNAKTKLLYPIAKIIGRIEPLEFNRRLAAIILKVKEGSKKENGKSKFLLKLIRNKQLIEALPLLNELLEKERMPELSEDIEITRRYLELASRLSLDDLSLLAQSADPKQRIYAVNLLGQSKRYGAYKLIKPLINDPDLKVRRAVLIAAWKLNRPELWPSLIDNLAVSDYSTSVIAVIKAVGEPVLDDLEAHFLRSGENNDEKIKIIKLIEAIGGKKALRLLRRKINHPDNDIRFRVLMSLKALKYQANKLEIPYIKEAMKKEVETIVWEMAAINDVSKQPRTIELQTALKYELRLARERVFVLLSLIYDSNTIQHVEENINKGDVESKGYALEILDMLLLEEDKKFVLPIFEKLSYSETIEKYKFVYPQSKISFEQRLIDIVYKDYSRINYWTKTMALVLLANTSLSNKDDILISHVLHPNLLLRETALKFLFLANNEQFYKTIDDLGETYHDSFYDIRSVEHKLKLGSPLSYDICKKLNENMYFVAIPAAKLLKIAETAQEVKFGKGDYLAYNVNSSNFFYLITKGGINVVKNEQVLRSYRSDELLGEITDIDDIDPDCKFKAVDDTTLIKMNIESLYDLMASDTQIMQKIINLIKLQTITQKYDEKIA